MSEIELGQLLLGEALVLPQHPVRMGQGHAGHFDGAVVLGGFGGSGSALRGLCRIFVAAAFFAGAFRLAGLFAG